MAKSPVPTPHIAADIGEVAKTVLLPGDPLRAKVIAENYLEDAVCFNTVRNMYGYTGNYKGKRISVMGSGMGIPSMGIYSYELYHFYEVENIIRIGSAGGAVEDVKLGDVIFAMGACTDSSFMNQYDLPGTYAPIADYELLERAVSTARRLKKPFRVGNVLTTEAFYNEDPRRGNWGKMGVLAHEMEAAGLYMTAARAGKKALAIVTISDHILTGESMDAKERQNSFHDMMEIALETVV